jgi:hypothetical protein
MERTPSEQIVYDRMEGNKPTDVVMALSAGNVAIQVAAIRDILAGILDQLITMNDRSITK